MVQIGRVVIGKGSTPKVMGIINVSPESFYKRSVKLDRHTIARTAITMEEEGASIIDVGAMSTAPYLDTVIQVDKEIERMSHAIKSIRESGCKLPISADTPRANVARAAIESGAEAINDVTGLKYDKQMSQVISNANIPVIIGAHKATGHSGGKISSTLQDLRESILIAKQAGIKKTNVIVDPSIGFYRAEGKNPFYTKIEGVPWHTRDIRVLSELDQLVKLAPVCVSISGKSFLGHLFGIKNAEDRIIPSIACELYCRLKGVSIIRTHNVQSSVQAQAMFQMLEHGGGKRL